MKPTPTTRTQFKSSLNSLMIDIFNYSVFITDSSHLQTLSGLSHSMDNLPKTTFYSSPIKSSHSTSKSLIDLGNSHRLSSPPRTSAVGSNQSSPALLNLLYERMQQQSEVLHTSIDS